jgi:hypothetical protein
VSSLPLAFNFSCLVRLDGSPAEVHQTDVRRGTRQDLTFFVFVRPQVQKPFSGALHLSGSSLSHLDDCPGHTRADKSARDGRFSGLGEGTWSVARFHAGREGWGGKRTPVRRRVHLSAIELVDCPALPTAL